MSVDWPKVSLGDLITLERRPVKIEPTSWYQEIGIYCFGRGVFHKAPRTGLEVGNKPLFLMQKGDFVLQVTFAWEGAVALISESENGMFGSTRFPTFRVNESRCNSHFLLNYLKTDEGINQLAEISPGSAGRNRVLSMKRIAEVMIPLPSLKEQARIVEMIDKLNHRVSSAQELRNQSLKETDSVLLAARESLFKPSKGWTELAVEEFCDPPQYGFTASALREPVGPRFLRITDIQNGIVNWKTVPYCQCSNPKKYLLQKGDLVFARTGGTTGKSFVINECPEAIFASYLIRLRVKSTVSIDYLYQYFQSPSYWEQISDKKSGTGQPNLNGSKLKKLRVPIAPQDDQDLIVKHIKRLEEKINALKAYQTKTELELNALLPSILNKAFKGEL